MGVLMMPTAVHIKAETLNSILKEAAALVGKPYRVGGTTTEGFDCSGFITYLYKTLLPNLPRLSRDMTKIGGEVRFGLWEPGDLLFYATGSNPKLINHVALWYGNDTLIHSVSDGPETGVIMTRASSKYWRDRYISARRVLPKEQNSNAVSKPPAPSEPITPTTPSPWDDFDGILRGDFESWLEDEERNFGAYREKYG